MDSYKIRVTTYEDRNRVQLELIKNDSKRVAVCHNTMAQGQEYYDKWMELYKTMAQRKGIFTGYEYVTKKWG